jgi:hypothetical protein
MGAWGAIIMSFFGACFVALTLALQFHWRGLELGLPFFGFAVILFLALIVIRLPGKGISPSKEGERAIMWSTIGEGVGLFIAANVVVNLHHSEMLLPAMALVVGLHFLPIAYAETFRPFYALGIALLLGAAIGFKMHPPVGGIIAGFTAAGALWVASLLAIVRDRQAKRMRLQPTS